MDLWSVIPIRVHQYTILSTMVSSIPLGNIWKWKLSSDFISSFNLTTNIHYTSMDILNLELMPCKQTYEMHIQMHHTSSWACSLYLCAQNFNWSPSFVISLPLCQGLPFVVFWLSLYTISPPLSLMTTKVQNVDSLRLSMSINGVRIIFPNMIQTRLFTKDI